MKHDFYRLNKQYKLIAIRNLTAYKSINEHNLICSVHFRKTTFFRRYLEIYIQELEKGNAEPCTVGTEMFFIQRIKYL